MKVKTLVGTFGMTLLLIEYYKSPINGHGIEDQNRHMANDDANNLH